MSDIIEISHVTKKYGAATVLNDVNISFEKGKIHGLIGRNGSGKTMLMKCICGFVPVTQGSVTVNGKKIGKDIDVPENLGAIIETPGFLNNYSGYNNLKFLAGINKKIGREQIREAILFVGLDPDSKKHVGRYSLGMRQRLGLAQAIMENPDILLLDEPTNHLDLDAIAWLEEFLINFENTVIVVSHDRYFLNKVCTQIADIDYAKIQLYAGNYDFWYESSQLLIKQMKEANKKKEEKIKELQDFIQRFSANASKSKQATSRKRALEKIELDEIRPSSRKYPYIDFRPAREIGNEVLQVEGISKTIDGVKVLDNISFIVGHDDKIAFVGSNELATTTLFKILTGEMEPDEGSFKWGVTTSRAYFPKDSAAEFNCDDTIVEWLTQYSPDPDPTYVRGFLGRMLFAGEDGVKKVKVLSGGEKVRCLISKMMIMGANVLIFDDPTNHLDMESITALNNGLIKFSGVSLFTSHDHQFIQTTANRIMEIVPSGQLIDKITTYDEYLESDEMARKRQGFAEAANDDED